TALFDAVASTDRFELVRAVTGQESDSRSEFTIRSQVTARGSSIDDLSGFLSIAVDTVSFFSAEDTVGLPSSEHLIELSHDSERETNLTLRGDVFEGELEGVYTFGTISKVASLWLGAAFRTLQAQTNNRLHLENAEDVEDGNEFEAAKPGLAQTETLLLRERDEAATFLKERGFLDGVDFTGGFRIKRMLDLKRLVGELPGYAANIAVRTGGRISADNIDLQIWLDADSLRGAAAEIDGLRGQISISGAYDGILEEFVESDISLDVARIGLGRDRISDLSLRFQYANRAGSLTLESSNEVDDSLSVGLNAALVVLPDRNEVVVSDAFLRRNDYDWQLSPDAVFDFYGDALRINGFQIVDQYAPDADRPPQRVKLTGVVSGHYADTLNIEAAYVSLDLISDLLDLRDHIGGEIDASVAVAHVLWRPEIVGDVVVRRLSYVGRDMGDLRVSSMYSGQGESLFIDAEIHQPREEGPLVKGYDARVSGTIAIPGHDSDVPFGALDITLEATAVELFFFEVIFSNEMRDVSGKAAGRGTITGVLTKPIFNAEMQILESDFLSPEFNLRLSVTGRVTVDSLGFHLHDALVTDPTGGRATIRGDLLFNDYRFFSFDLSVDLEELMIMNVKRSEDLAFYGEVWVSGSATLTGPLQRTLLRSTNIVTSQRSRFYMPVTDDKIESDQTYIVFTDSTGEYEVKKRRFLLDARPVNERAFIDGMDMNFSITIPPESNVLLVFDALLGEVIDARGTGRVQFLRIGGEYSAFGTLTLSSGNYLFTAGEVFQRRFVLDAGGTITWDGDPIDAALAIPATYRARASLAGLPGQNPDGRVPIRVIMNLSGRLLTPEVALRIELDVDQRQGTVIPPGV
ncbi:MAG: translocation/assembly module TamB domain-containing protein, partial [Rhodothermia bacterium]